MTPTVAHLPKYLQARAKRYPYQTCHNCGEEILIRDHTNNRVNDKNPHPRNLLSQSKHAGRRYCTRACLGQHRTDGFAPRQREPARPHAPSPDGALRFDLHPTPTPRRREPTRREWGLLRAAAQAHPLLARALAGTLTDSWYPHGSTTAVGMKEAA